MFESCIENKNKIISLFKKCSSAEEKYKTIINLGKHLEELDIAKCIDKNIVPGCQSTMYLASEFKEGKVYFKASTDAIISAGLAQLLILTFSGETPEAILKFEPTFIEELGIPASLTPGRANGLYQIHLRMKQDALKHLIN